MRIVNKVFAADIYEDLVERVNGASAPASYFTEERIVTLVNGFTGVVFAFGILGIALAMFLFVISGGSPAKTKQAQDALLFGVIAAAIGLTAGSLARLIFGTVGFTDFLGIGF